MNYCPRLIGFCLTILCTMGIFRPCIGYSHEQVVIEALEVNIHNQPNQPTLVYDDIVIHKLKWLADTESTLRIATAAKNLGWNVIGATQAHTLSKQQLEKSFALLCETSCQKEHIPKSFPVTIPIVQINYIFSQGSIKTVPSLATQKSVCTELDHSIVGIANCAHYPWDWILKEKIKNLRFFSAWYPTVCSTDYTPVGPNKLVYCGSAWSAQHANKQGVYWRLWNQLDQTDYFVVYGFRPTWECLNHYQGCIPADGHSFVTTLHEQGMVLVLHSEHHLATHTPSGRIFEAAAAASIIICDGNQFVMDAFGDSVLYIDESRDDMFEQIDRHVQWIRTHPEQAIDMARKAHALFIQHFTLEQQLLHLYQQLKDSDSLNSSMFSCYKNYYIDQSLQASKKMLRRVKNYLYASKYIHACRLYIKNILKKYNTA